MLKGSALISQLHARQLELATGRLVVVEPSDMELEEGERRDNRHSEAMADLLRDAAAELAGKKRR